MVKRGIHSISHCSAFYRAVCDSVFDSVYILQDQFKGFRVPGLTLKLRIVRHILCNKGLSEVSNAKSSSEIWYLF